MGAALRSSSLEEYFFHRGRRRCLLLCALELELPLSSQPAPLVPVRAIDEVLARFTVEVCSPDVEAAQDRAASGAEEHQAVYPRSVEAYSEAEVEAAGEIGPDGRAGLDIFPVRV
ncbi:hypothetical protein [Streptomyces sp. NPDC059874]|uniref:hypothetical protein n=1 Tax=Streptomyces sp. NPDC059874 TaxID=3346983 RepID=UPI003669A2C8